MADVSEVLRQLAIQIRDEKKMGANTANRVGSLLLSLVNAVDIAELEKFFLSKTKPDTTKFLLSLLGGLLVEKGITSDLIQSKLFTEGALGSGFVLRRNEKTGKSYLEVDELFVRMKAYFVELVIEKLSHVGGQIILTPARMKCTEVEELSDRYRCYFNNSDGEKTITNDFIVGDQARCQTFNIKAGTSTNVSNSYYWRFVMAVGDDYIDLSKSDCDTGSTIPQAGDEIVQLGNRTNASRQNAIIISAYGSDAPSITQYAGINSYSLSGKEVTKISPSGNSFTGDFKLKTGENIGEVAKAANKAAEEAQQTADTAKESLQRWADDGCVSPTEKQALKNEQTAIRAERTEITADATKYGVSSTAFLTAYTAYDADLTYYTREEPENIEILASFSTDQKAYYDARTALLNAIAAAIKSYIGTTATTEAGTVRTELQTQIDAVPGKITLAVSESKTYADNAVNGIQIGGRNLLLKSRDIRTINGYNGIYFSFSEPLTVGEQYTLSINPAEMQGGTVVAYFSDTHGSVPRQGFSGNFKSIKSATLIANQAWKGLTFYQEVSGVSGTHIFSASHFKLEKGNKATDWTPAPEDTDSTVNNLAQRVSKAESEITLMPNQITLAVSESKTYADNAVNGIQIGGRNLLRNSPSLSSKITYTAPTNDAYNYYTNIYCELTAGTEYTISYKSDGVKRSTHSGGQDGVGIWLYDGASHYFLGGGKTFTVPTGGKYWIRTNIYLTGKIYSFWDIKVELGNKATDWTPAPEDVAASVSALGTRVTSAETSITQQAGQIALKASQTDVTALANRLSTAEFKITSDAINLTVTSQIESKISESANKNGTQLLPQNWATGSGGNDFYNQNGTAAENQRVYGMNHLGNQVVLWECRPSGNNNDDGGWNSGSVTIDKTKAYRFSVFVKKSDANGTFYLGVGANTVCNLNTTTVNSNPYFDYRSAFPVYNRWYLVVGYVYPYGTTGNSHNGEMWDCETGERVASGLACFNWANVTGSLHRCYHFYNGTTVTRQWMWQPRIDLIDGNEPSAASLIGLTFEKIKSQISVTANKISIGSKNIDLTGAVTFSSLASDAQKTINSKQDAIVNGKTLIDGGYINTILIQAKSIKADMIQTDGLNVTNAELKNVKVTGSLRSPFVYVGDSISVDYSDNVSMSGGGGWTAAYSLPWTVNQSGRRICIVNYKWNNILSTGSASIPAPSGKYFFEDGIQKSSLAMSREVIELMGYGDAAIFYGWIVTRRLDIMTDKRYGRQLKILAQGIVTGTSSSASLTSYKTFDGTTLSVSRVNTGHYRVTFSSTWGLAANQYIVMLVGYGGVVGNTNNPCKATLQTCTNTSFEVTCSDDDTRNDGSFMFQITNMNDWG